VRRESVENLAHRFTTEPEHVRRVASLSLDVFDGLAAAGLHDLGDPERELLWAACVLHDIGTAIDYDDHHRHSQYLILNAGLPGFSPRELELVGLIARYHRKGEPDASELGHLARPGDSERVRLLSAVIRLAEQLERSRDGAIRRVAVAAHDGTITLAADADPERDATVPIWAAGRSADLLAQVLDRKVEIAS
jgi:exopolyphosphatase/guanosine-5'-triphosphate,3'-diphosphate pyrophosphatase